MAMMHTTVTMPPYKAEIAILLVVPMLLLAEVRIIPLSLLAPQLPVEVGEEENLVIKRLAGSLLSQGVKVTSLV